MELSVEALTNGTVIDHIPAGQGLVILRQFGLNDLGKRVTVGFNLRSSVMEQKDIIKVTDVFFSQEEANQLALFAPQATVNVIKNYEVVEKHALRLPEEIHHVFRCPNSNCATHTEPVQSRFHVKHRSGVTKLKCHYCEKTYSRELVTAS